MNNERRKVIEEARAKVEEALNALESVRDQEQEAFDNLTDSLQQTEQGQRTEAAAEALDEACSNLESVITDLDTAAE